MLLLGDMLGDRLVDGITGPFGAVRMLFQGPAVASIERVIARDL